MPRSAAERLISPINGGVGDLVRSAIVPAGRPSLDQGRPRVAAGAWPRPCARGEFSGLGPTR